MVAPRPAVQTILFFSDIFTTAIFSGRVWGFILTTLTSVLKTILRCFWHCVQSNKQLATYFLGVLSLALVLLRVVSGGSAHTSWPGWTLASVGSTALWPPLCTTTQNIGLVPVPSSPCLLACMESWTPVCMLSLQASALLGSTETTYQGRSPPTSFWPTALLSCLTAQIAFAATVWGYPGLSTPHYPKPTANVPRFLLLSYFPCLQGKKKKWRRRRNFMQLSPGAICLLVRAFPFL